MHFCSHLIQQRKVAFRIVCSFNQGCLLLVFQAWLINWNVWQNPFLAGDIWNCPSIDSLCTRWQYLCQHPAKHNFFLSSSPSNALWIIGKPITTVHVTLFFRWGSREQSNKNKTLFLQCSDGLKEIISRQDKPVTN